MARIEGEVPSDTLEAYRQAGTAAYALLDRLDEERLARKIEPIDPWSRPSGTQVEQVCAWNAFMLQALGDAFLDADYAANPDCGFRAAGHG